MKQEEQSMQDKILSSTKQEFLEKDSAVVGIMEKSKD